MEEFSKDIGLLVYSSFSNATPAAAVSGAHPEAVDHLHSAPVRKDEVLQPSSMAVPGLWAETLMWHCLFKVPPVF